MKIGHQLSHPTYEAQSGSYNPATGRWTGLDLDPGQTAELDVTAQVDSTAGGSVTNTATVSLPDGFTDPTPANNTDDDTDSIVLAVLPGAMPVTGPGAGAAPLRILPVGGALLLTGLGLWALAAWLRRRPE